MISNNQYKYKRVRTYNKSFLSILVLFLISFSFNCAWADSGDSISTYFDTVQKIFIGYYQRPAAPGGLIYWAGRLNASGGNLTEIIEAFANSAESQALYGTIGNNIGSVVVNIFEALFNRVPAQAGLDYYVNGFNSGQFTPATIMLNVLYGAQNEDLISVNNKVTAANIFTRTIDPDLDGRDFQYYYSGNGDARRARDFLSTVTWDPATIPTEDEIRASLIPMTSYTCTILLPEGWRDSLATGINDNGEVVGGGYDASGQHWNFLYSNGAYTTLLLPESWGWKYVYTTGINDNGQVVGGGYDAAGQQLLGFLYTKGTYTILLPEGWESAITVGINDNGQVVGGPPPNAILLYVSTPPWPLWGFLYSNGTYTLLPLPEGLDNATTVGINNNGQVVGYGSDASGHERGFLYSNGTYTLLLPEGWEHATTAGINNNGQVVGEGHDASGQERGFLYSNGTYTILPLPEGLNNATTTGINDNGEVVGYGYHASRQQVLGFLYSNGTYTILPLPEGLGDAYATGINNNGEVVGNGLGASASGWRGFIATPQ